MNHLIDEVFQSICQKIMEESKSIEQWSAIESCDMFQEGNYCGGFDADEKEFCFSFYEKNQEFWFQVSLDQIKDIAAGDLVEIHLRKADH